MKAWALQDKTASDLSARVPPFSAWESLISRRSLVRAQYRPLSVCRGLLGRSPAHRRTRPLLTSRESGSGSCFRRTRQYRWLKTFGAYGHQNPSVKGLNAASRETWQLLRFGARSVCTTWAARSARKKHTAKVRVHTEAAEHVVPGRAIESKLDRVAPGAGGVAVTPISVSAPVTVPLAKNRWVSGTGTPSTYSPQLPSPEVQLMVMPELVE